jgi:hypothetical protein
MIPFPKGGLGETVRCVFGNGCHEKDGSKEDSKLRNANESVLFKHTEDEKKRVLASDNEGPIVRLNTESTPGLLQQLIRARRSQYQLLRQQVQASIETRTSCRHREPMPPKQPGPAWIPNEYMGRATKMS